MKIKVPDQPSIWYCPICGKYDTPEAPEPMATPEHHPYRGIDLGTCPATMIPLYSKEAIQKANE